MKAIQDAILKIGGVTSGDEYTAICLAIYEARKQQPVMPQMKEISAAVRKTMHKNKASSVSKAVECAVADLWNKGDREVMESYQQGWGSDQPKAKDFVSVMAHRLWDGNDQRDAHER